MARHKVHGWSSESAGAAVSVFGLRKKYTRNEKKTSKNKAKNYHRQKICPLPNCMHVTEAIYDHLHVFHKLPRDKHYYNLLQQAKIFIPDLVPTTPQKSPKKLFGKNLESIDNATKTREPTMIPLTATPKIASICLPAILKTPPLINVTLAREDVPSIAHVQGPKKHIDFTMVCSPRQTFHPVEGNKTT